MEILLITDSYPPEIRSASHLMLELAEGLRERGHNVFVATTYPEYNLSEDQKNVIFPEFSEEKGISVIRIKTLPHHNVNFIIRGISQLMMPYIFYYKVKKYIKKVDLILVYSPPLTLATVGSMLAKYYKAKFFLNVQDLFPQNAVDLGILKNRVLIAFFKNIEKKAYLKADKIFVHSEGNKNWILSCYPFTANKVYVLHNWIDVNEFEGIKRTGKFRKMYGLENRFIILFAGVMGPSQSLDFIIEVAEDVKNIEDLVFLFVGDGMEKDRLKEMVKEKKLTNVVFKPFVSKQDYPYLVKDCDVGLVSLSSKNKTPVVPGKILGYMAAGIPIIAFVNKESDAHHIIREALCGYTSVHGDKKRAIELVNKICMEKEILPEMGYNGYNYVKKHFEKNVCIEQLEECFTKN